MRAKKFVEDWQTKLERDRLEFFGRWTWDRVLFAWRSRLSEFGLDLETVFRTIEVNDPGSRPDREPGLSWWRIKEIDINRRDVLKHFERYPGTVGPLHPGGTMRRGEIDTLDHLWAAKDEPDKVAGILISGSLFSRIESSRKGPSRDNWPRVVLMRDLQAWAYAAWRDPGTYWGWHYASTTTFPTMSDDNVYTIDSMEALVRYIAEEHAVLFSVYTPVALTFVQPASNEV